MKNMRTLRQYSIVLSDDDDKYITKLSKSLDYSRSKTIRMIINIYKKEVSEHEIVENKLSREHISKDK